MKKSAIALTITVGLLTCGRIFAQSAPTTRPAQIPSSGFNNNDRNNNDQNNNDRNNRRERRLQRQRGNNFNRGPTSRPLDMTNDYSLMNTRSIFFKGRFTPAQDPNQQTVPVASVEAQAITFNGLTVSQYGDRTAVGAYLENTQSGTVQVVKVGDIVASGRIAGINITTNTLDYDLRGRMTHLTIGQNLAGEQIYGVNSSVASTTEPTIDLSGPNADILKKLMQRRQQELNGGK